MTPPKLQARKLSRLTNINHAFFTRNGGVSDGTYKSLNCGYGSDDSTNNVNRNRSLTAQALAVSPANLISTYQVHSSEVVIVEQPWKWDMAPQADGMVTCLRGIALGILTADCAPVIFYDTKNEIIGAAHAGWKGALSGVIEATIESIESIGGSRNSIFAAIGPCISQANYQVGPEFKAQFLERSNLYGQFFKPTQDEHRKDNWQFDLKAFVASKLHEIKISQIEILTTCSYETESDFYSYRRATHRNESNYGRNLSAIVLNEA